jgi:hypothetical protein
MNRIKNGVVLLGAFLIGMFSILQLPITSGNTAWSYGMQGQANMGMGMQDATQCDGTIKFVDAQGTVRILHKNPNVEESEGH